MEHIKISDSESDPRRQVLAEWLVQEGLAGATQNEVLEGYSAHLVRMGVPVMRIHVAQNGFHPRYGGVGYSWTRDNPVKQERYNHSETPRERWLNSPLYHILEHDLRELRERLDRPGFNSPFPMLNMLRDNGGTDYFAIVQHLSNPDPIGEIDPNFAPEGFLMSLTSDSPDGFDEKDLNLVRYALPFLGLALKSASNRKMAQELLGVYLGPDAGERVLSGELRRGSLQQINAVICFFDLTGFTRLSEQMPGTDLIEMLNDYFGLAVDEIQGQGGHVLKFMGDGLLAMFDQPELPDAARAALEATVNIRRRLAERNTTRSAESLPTTGCTIALHAGEILYGNIGADTRLDFTVIGPAVNLTARLSGMHSLVGQDVILSEEVRRNVAKTPHDLVSLGRHMMRGVPHPRELFTVYEPD